MGQIRRRASRLWRYLLLVVLLSAFCFLTLHIWLTPYSVAYKETTVMTAGYFLYAAIGLLFSAPAPFVAVLIICLCRDRVGVRRLIRDIFRTEKPLKTALITGGFCLPAPAYALLCGTPNGSPWYMFPPGFLIMTPFVGIAEETCWRGLLQPELDTRKDLNGSNHRTKTGGDIRQGCLLLFSYTTACVRNNQYLGCVISAESKRDNEIRNTDGHRMAWPVLSRYLLLHYIIGHL